MCHSFDFLPLPSSYKNDAIVHDVVNRQAAFLRVNFFVGGPLGVHPYIRNTPIVSRTTTPRIYSRPHWGPHSCVERVLFVTGSLVIARRSLALVAGTAGVSAPSTCRKQSRPTTALGAE